MNVYRHKLFSVLVITLGLSLCPIFGVTFWYTSANYHKVPCQIEACEPVNPKNCSCIANYDQQGTKILTCDLCYDIQCMANISGEANWYRKLDLHGSWNNITINRAIDTVLEDKVCCVTHFNTASALNKDNCENTIQTYHTLLVVVIVLFAILLTMVVENFHYGLTKGRLSKLNISEGIPKLRDFKHLPACAHPLTLSSLDYCSSFPKITLTFIPVPVLALIFYSIVMLSYYVGKDHYTSAYMHNCTVLQAPKSTGNLTYGVNCLGDFYLDHIHANVSWTFTTANYFTQTAANLVFLDYDNSQKNVVYFSEYNSPEGSHYHTLYDASSSGDSFFFLHKIIILWALLLAIPITFLVLFGGIRELWRRKLLRDYAFDQSQLKQVSEYQPLISPVSPEQPSYMESQTGVLQEKYERDRQEYSNLKEKGKGKQQTDIEEGKTVLTEKEKQLNAHYSGPSYTSYSTNNSINNSSQNNEISDNLCGICMEHRLNTALGCGHVLCRACSLQVAKCPFCKAPITSRIQIFI